MARDEALQLARKYARFLNEHSDFAHSEQELLLAEQFLSLNERLNETEQCFQSSTESYERDVTRLREAVRVCGRHLYDCCRTDIDWRLQMETHDQAVNAVAWAECDEPYPDHFQGNIGANIAGGQP